MTEPILSNKQAEKTGKETAADILNSENPEDLKLFREKCKDPTKFAKTYEPDTILKDPPTTSPEGLKKFVKALCDGIKPDSKGHDTHPIKPSQTPTCEKSPNGCGTFI